MVADPILIRRPLMECEGRKMAGFDLHDVDRLIGVPTGEDLSRDVQTCKRKDGGCDAQGTMSASANSAST